MKKSVILIISIIYILAIVVVGFIGMEIDFNVKSKYVEEIIIISEDYVKNTDEEKAATGIDGYIQKNYQPGLQVWVKCKVIPDDADWSSVTFNIDNNDGCTLIDNKDGTATVEFSRSGSCVLLIEANDNSASQTRKKILIKAIGNIF